MKRIICLAFLSITASVVADEKRYDFRASAAYEQLSVADRQRLQQVRRDQFLLWGALDIYADEHSGGLPTSLDELVPAYLAELPTDPFATQQTANAPVTRGCVRSKGGFGYPFMRGASGNRAWVISSVGLPDFPYLAERGNVGLYICKGLWISGVNPIIGGLFRAQDSATKASQSNRSETKRTSAAAGARR